MPQPSTLSYVADIVVRRVLSEVGPNTDIAQALEAAYPFDRSPQGRRIWLEALIRHAVQGAGSQSQAPGTEQPGGDAAQGAGAGGCSCSSCA